MTPLLHLSRTLFLFLDVVLARTITVFSQHHVSHSCPRISRPSCPSLRSIIPDYISHMHTRHRHQLSSSPSSSSAVCCLLFSPLTPTQHTSLNAYNWNFFLSFFFLFFLTVLLITPLCLPSSAYAMTTRYRPVAPPRTYSTHLKTSFQTPTLSFLSSPGISFGICRVETLLYAR